MCCLQQVLCRAAEADRARLRSLEEQLAVLTDNAAEQQHKKMLLQDKIKQLEVTSLTVIGPN